LKTLETQKVTRVLEFIETVQFVGTSKGFALEQSFGDKMLILASFTFKVI